MKFLIRLHILFFITTQISTLPKLRDEGKKILIQSFSKEADLSPCVTFRISGALSAHRSDLTVYSKVLSAMLLASLIVRSELARVSTF
jgi:hypothetical protein